MEATRATMTSCRRRKKGYQRKEGLCLNRDTFSRRRRRLDGFTNLILYTTYHSTFLFTLVRLTEHSSAEEPAVFCKVGGSHRAKGWFLRFVIGTIHQWHTLTSFDLYHPLRYSFVSGSRPSFFLFDGFGPRPVLGHRVKPIEATQMRTTCLFWNQEDRVNPFGGD